MRSSILLRVLLVEDDEMIAKTLTMSLRYQGFRLTVAASLQEAEGAFASQEFDLLLLDINLPDGSGIDWCRRVRQCNEDIPILMHTKCIEEAAAVASIEGGADDYIRKPCGLLELAARMKRLIQRGPRAQVIESFGPIAIDLNRHAVTIGSNDLHLSKREFRILLLLTRSNGETVTRETILRSLGNNHDIYDRTIDSHMSHLRRKMKDVEAGVRIVAIYGVGYRLDVVCQSDR